MLCRCKGINKRCLALGGAKNHLVALEDCDVEGTVRDVTASAFGCAGQRCMAASVLIVVGKQDELLQRLKEEVSKIKLGVEKGEMGPVITPDSLANVRGYLDSAEKFGSELLVDGRKLFVSPASTSLPNSTGNWIGPSIILHNGFGPNERALSEEIFGPVLSVIRVETWAEAIKIENGSPFGNAACVYTQRGGAADWFVGRFRAGMLGVNVGIPVPREPFAFGGLAGTDSKFGGYNDITSEGAVGFFTDKIKVTTRWPVPVELLGKGESGEGKKRKREKEKEKGGVEDAANFNGKM